MTYYVPPSQALANDAANGNPLALSSGGTGATSAGAARASINGTGRTDQLLDTSGTAQTKVGPIAIDSGAAVPPSSFTSDGGISSKNAVGTPPAGSILPPINGYSNLRRNALTTVVRYGGILDFENDNLYSDLGEYAGPDIIAMGGGITLAQLKALFAQKVRTSDLVSVPAGATWTFEIKTDPITRAVGSADSANFFAMAAPGLSFRIDSKTAGGVVTVGDTSVIAAAQPTRIGSGILASQANAASLIFTIANPTAGALGIHGILAYCPQQSPLIAVAKAYRIFRRAFRYVFSQNTANDATDEYATNGVTRWRLGRKGATENFVVERHNAAGTLIDTPLSIDIATGVVTANALKIGTGDAIDSYTALGSFTPSLLGETTAGAPTYTIRVAEYERIGRTVRVFVDIAINALGGMAGNVRLTGLPFTSTSGSPRRASILFKEKVNTPALVVDADGMWAIVPPNATYAELSFQQRAANAKRVDATDFDLTGPARFTGTITYTV